MNKMALTLVLDIPAARWLALRVVRWDAIAVPS